MGVHPQGGELPPPPPGENLGLRPSNREAGSARTTTALFFHTQSLTLNNTGEAEAGNGGREACRGDKRRQGTSVVARRRPPSLHRALGEVKRAEMVEAAAGRAVPPCVPC